MGDQVTHFATGDDGPVDGYYELVWKNLGADPEDVNA